MSGSTQGITSDCTSARRTQRTSPTAWNARTARGRPTSRGCRVPARGPPARAATPRSTTRSRTTTRSRATRRAAGGACRLRSWRRTCAGIVCPTSHSSRPTSARTRTTARWPPATASSLDWSLACCPRSAPTASSSSPTTRAPRTRAAAATRAAGGSRRSSPAWTCGRARSCPADRPLRRAAQHRDGLRAAVARRRARSAARIARAAVPKPRDPLALGAGRPQAIRFAVG